jgi:hypothetical protein
VETDENGCFSRTKFSENMKFAAEDAVSRISGTPYAGCKMNAYMAPDENSWIFEASLEQKFKEFLKIDSTNHRIQHNFKISPKGPIWNKICELFSVDKSKCVSTKTSIFISLHIINAMGVLFHPTDSKPCFQPHDIFLQNAVLSRLQHMILPSLDPNQEYV